MPYSEWTKLSDYVTRLTKLNKGLIGESESLKQNSKALLDRLAILKEQLQTSLVTIEELKAELEKVRLSLEALEASLTGLKKDILQLQTERDIAIAGCVVLGVTTLAVTVYAIVKNNSK